MLALYEISINKVAKKILFVDLGDVLIKFEEKYVRELIKEEKFGDFISMIHDHDRGNPDFELFGMHQKLIFGNYFKRPVPWKELAQAYWNCIGGVHAPMFKALQGLKKRGIKLVCLTDNNHFCFYSTTVKLWAYAGEKRKLSNVDDEGNEWNSQFDGWKFKDDESVNPSEAGKIDFIFWQGKSDYDVTWEYDSKGNSYKRLNGGTPHLNKNNDKQIEAKNVVIVFMAESTARDNYTEGSHLLYKTTGDGEAIIFQDGKAIKGRWRKKDVFTRIKFYDTRGSEVALNRGQVFIEILPKGNTVNY